MKKILFSIVVMLIQTSLYSQFGVIDDNNPIANWSYSYSKNNVLQFEIIWNTVETTKSNQTVVSNSVEASFNGEIFWDDGSSEVVKGVFNQSQNVSVYKYAADIKTKNGIFVPKSSQKKWRRIDASITYNVGSKNFSIPRFTAYPPTEVIVIQNDQEELTISLQASRLAKSTGVFNVKSKPGGIPFEVNSLSIKGGGKNVSQTWTQSDLINRFANNGNIFMEVNTVFEIEIGVPYDIEVNGKKIGVNKDLVGKGKVIFVNKEKKKILNRNPSHSLVILDKDELLDNDIITQGIGVLGMEFTNDEYQRKIVIEPLKNSGVVTGFKLSGLKSISDDSYSTFYYTVDGQRLQPGYIISKKAPILTNFKFQGTNENNEIQLSFNLPSYASDDKVSIKLTNVEDKKELTVSGYIVKKDNLKPENFSITLPQTITKAVADKKVLNVKFEVIYNNNPLYGLEVSFFNQRELNEKIAELTAEVSGKPKEKQQSTIKRIVGEIAQIANALGSQIEQKTIDEFASDLSAKDAKKEKIKSTLKDIGKWASFAGKLLLPIFPV